MTFRKDSSSLLLSLFAGTLIVFSDTPIPSEAPGPINIGSAVFEALQAQERVGVLVVFSLPGSLSLSVFYLFLNFEYVEYI